MCSATPRRSLREPPTDAPHPSQGAVTRVDGSRVSVPALPSVEVRATRISEGD